MNTKQLLGLLGSIVLFIGVFAPIVSLPIIGNMNYFQNGKGDGTIVLVLALISLVLVATKTYGGLWFTGLGSMAVIAFTFFNFQKHLSEMKSKMEVDLAGNPFRGLADMAMISVQLQWGWALLIVGAVLLIASAALKDALSQNRYLSHEITASESKGESVIQDALDSVFRYLCSGCSTFQSNVVWCPECGTPNPHHPTNKAAAQTAALGKFQCEGCGKDMNQADNFCGSCGKSKV